MNEIRVHFEVKGELSSDLKKFVEADYIIFDSDGKVSAEVPADWEGFRNGTILDILKHFNESVYIGVAFITDSTNYIVTDFKNNPIVPFKDAIDNRKIYRYVKKDVSVLSCVSSEDDSFEVKRYILNLKFVNPVVKVLDVYSVGSQSRIPSSMFQ